MARQKHLIACGGSRATQAVLIATGREEQRDKKSYKEGRVKDKRKVIKQGNPRSDEEEHVES